MVTSFDAEGRVRYPETHRGLSLPLLHPALAPYRASLRDLSRPAWLLRCRDADAVSRVHTHIGGHTPFLPAVEGWPACETCGKPLDFVWQVDFADFQGVGAFADRGLFQFFYCWDCFHLPQDGVDLTTRWYPDFDARRMRDTPQLDAPPRARARAGGAGPHEVEVVPFLSVPAKGSPNHLIPDAIQNQRVGGEARRLWAVYSFTEGLYLEDAMVSRVGGYPPWVQFEDDTPRCPVCGAWAAFVGAIGSDDTGLMWGDSGYWYFFACEATPQCHGLARPLMVAQGY